MTAPRVLWARADDVPDDWPLPAYKTSGAAGVDLPVYLPGGDVMLAPGGRMLVRTGWHVAIPSGYEGTVRSRSGLALREGVIILNGPGTVDCDFRGEMMLLLHHVGGPIAGGWYQDLPFAIRHGERLAQLVISPVVQGEFAVVPELPGTERGGRGWGSTGR